MKNTISFLLSNIILLFIFRTAIPNFKYPFLFIYLFIVIITISRIRHYSRINFKTFFLFFKLVLIVFIIQLIWFLLSQKFFLVVFKDLLNFLILFSFFILLSFYITDRRRLLYFTKLFSVLIIFYAIIISFYSLSNFFSSRISLVNIDYNFALIPILFAIIVVLEKTIKNKCSGITLITICYNLILLFFSWVIFFSGSRRGILALIFIYLVLLIIIVLRRKSIISLKSLLRNLSVYIILLLLSLVSVIIIFLKTNSSFKNNLIKKIGIENSIIFKGKLTQVSFRYVKSFNSQFTYKEWFDRLWFSNFDPSDPESGWGYRISKIVYPLEGKNVSIVPNNCKGYLIDNSCDVDIRDNNAFSSTTYKILNVNQNDQVYASVFCFVSKNFDGSWVRLSSEAVTGRRADFYDLDRKGEWQRLTLGPFSESGRVSLILYWAKYGVNSISNLTGYVIFAYPTYEVIQNEDVIASDSLYSATFQEQKLNHEKYSVIRKYDYQKASILNIFHKLPLAFILQKAQDPDPIRNWIKNVFKEDTTYFGYSTDINFPHDPTVGIQGRTDRWKFAWEIFAKEYNWRKKILGGGFDHLNWYGYYFYNNKTKSDYPHNPFLSVLLYSGILGLGLYLFLMYKVFLIYIKYIREYYMLFIFFLITFFFSFFSAGNPFDPPVMGFFVLLPFFIDYIHKKDNRK